MKVRSIKASEDRWETWAKAAEQSGKSVNAWVAEACDLVAERDLAELRRAQSLRREREQVRVAMTGGQFDFRPDPKRKK